MYERIFTHPLLRCIISLQRPVKKSENNSAMKIIPLYATVLCIMRLHHT